MRAAKLEARQLGCEYKATVSTITGSAEEGEAHVLRKRRQLWRELLTAKAQERRLAEFEGRRSEEEGEYSESE